jgi:hypothetical protein
MNHAPRRFLATGALLASLGALLAGCGGGSGYAPTAPAPPPPVASHDIPASALTSIQALVQFARSLMPSETAEPLRLNDVVLPVSDTAEPVELGGA